METNTGLSGSLSEYGEILTPPRVAKYLARAWAKITSHTVRALDRMQREQVDQEVMGWVFSKLSGLSG